MKKASGQWVESGEMDLGGIDDEQIKRMLAASQ
jgi:hypothetical protein